MEKRRMITVDGNEAVASVAHRMNEVIAIYPITPASTMGELADEWSAKGKKNLWGTVPEVVEMQSEAGAAGAVHGALQAGSLTTTFTASQGLLLMIPNMYKIAGELTPFCLHVAARTLATHALSIFGDHSDVMSCRQTGFALLAAGSVQEAQDFAAIAQAATLETRVPFLHFFDGFRTSHEVSKIDALSDDDLRAMQSEEAIAAHRRRALSPEHPVIRGTAQNPDTFFQAREACNSFYANCPPAVQAVMDRFARLTGRAYHLFDYHGHPEAERLIIMMGSGSEAAHETVDWMLERGERVGLLRVRLYRPFDASAMLAAIPHTVKKIAVLDRTKEPGAVGDPLHLDVMAAYAERAQELGGNAQTPFIIGGRYGLSSKEFNPAMVKAVFDNLGSARPKNHFTVGINDDVTHMSLAVEQDFDIEAPDTVRAVFYGLGSDGTVGSNKNTIKVIGEETPNFAQGYFIYDSKKSGAITISHLRFGPRPIRSTYRINQASFVACHQPGFIQKQDVLSVAAPGAVFVLNTSLAPGQVWNELPLDVQEQMIAKRLRFFVIDAYAVAGKAGLGRHISTVMQTCFFAISKVLPREEAIAQIKKAIEKSFGKRGSELVRRNFAAVDDTLEHLHEVEVPAQVSSTRRRPAIVSPAAPDFIQRVTAVILSNLGDGLPVSAFPVDGTWPTATSQWEKRNIALTIPRWDEKVCIQCNKCSMVCPHAAIRPKVVPAGALAEAPQGFVTVANKAAPALADHRYVLQVAPEDCTGCGLCSQVCPAKDKSNPRHKALDMVTPSVGEHESERTKFAYFLALPEADRTKLPLDVKGSQFLQPLFEFSGACAGCGETPYVKLLTQLFGDRAMIANATGCSSIYGGNLPTTPYAVTTAGRGPAWANSLFEDNAEFGFGMRVALDAQAGHARELMMRLETHVGTELVQQILTAPQGDEAGIEAQRARVAFLRGKLATLPGEDARRLLLLADTLVKKSVWLVGGDGWAYDIGYGGLDHVIASNRDVNILVMDTEVYSNTGGQQSKATPMGAAAKFAAAGKAIGKKDLGLIAMSYGHAYVASVAMGANDAHTLRVFREAESFPGPSLIIAYSHCIAHGYDLIQGLELQKLAVRTGAWPLFRFDPRRAEKGESSLVVDAAAPKTSLRDYTRNQGRFKMVEMQDPKRYAQLMQAAESAAHRRFALYEHLAQVHFNPEAPAKTNVQPETKTQLEEV